MSNAGHTAPSSYRPGYTLLPDGRGQFVTRHRLGVGEQLSATLAIAWGTEAKDAEGIDVTHPRLTHLAGLRLVDGQRTQGGEDGQWLWLRIYETQHATEETQIGGVRIVNDENGREQYEVTLRQFTAQVNGTAIPYVRGAKGAALAGYANASLSWEQAVSSGSLRMITRRYDQSNAAAGTADSLGAVVISYPFNQLGDAAHAVATQFFEQQAANYAPLALNATRSVSVGGANTTLYFVGDSPPQPFGPLAVRFARRWATVPATRIEYETYTYSFPGYRATQAEVYAARDEENRQRLINRYGFTSVVASQVTLEFYLVGAGTGYANEGAIPLVARLRHARAIDGQEVSALDVFLSSVDELRTRATLPYTTYYNLLTSPTRTAYQALVAANTYNVVAECDVRRYLGNIFVRRTRRVKAL